MATTVTEPFRLNCLIVSQDPNTINEVACSAAELAITVHQWSEFADLAKPLNRHKFEAVVIDYQTAKDTAAEAIRLVRRSASNKSILVLAITDGDEQIASAFLAGANLTIKRPLSRESILSTLKLAYGSMIRERRRYFRCVASIPTSVQQGDRKVLCQTMNISEGGMAVIHEHPLHMDRRTIVRFRLPSQKDEIAADAVVRWSETGTAGLYFVSLTIQHKAQLQAWLAEKLEEQLPASVRAQFHKTDDA
jgi:DNA-binding NarL/FixJ family response regulator